MLLERVVEGAPPAGSIELAWAGEVASGIVLPPFSSDGDEHLRIHTWLYAETLEELGLAPGPFQAYEMPDSTCRTDGEDVVLLEPMPAADRALVVELEGRSRSEWSESSAELLQSLEMLHLETRVPNPCAAFATHYGTFPDTCPEDDGCGRRTAFLAPFDAETMIVGRIQSETAEGMPEVRTGHTYRVRRFDRIEPLETAANPAESGVVIDRELLVLREGGELECVGQDGRDCSVLVPPPIPTSTHAYSTVARVGSTLFAARDDGRIWRYTDRWSEVSVPRAARCDARALCSNTEIGGCDLVCRITIAVQGEEVLFVFPYLGAAFRLEGDRLVEARLPVSEVVPDVPLSGALVAGARGAAGTSLGRILLETEEGAWQHVLSVGTQPIFAVAPLDSGLLAGAEDGVLAQYHPEYGACAELPLSFARITDIVPIGDDFLVAGMRRGNSELDVVWLERSPEAGEPCTGAGLTQVPDP
jgi:hypothetical protein